MRVLDDEALRALHARERLVDGDAPMSSDGIALSVDLSGLGSRRRHRRLPRQAPHRRDRRRQARAATTSLDFWEPIPARTADRSLVLDPDEFYILVSREAVHVPPDYAAEMVPFDPLVGEFRVHYAGFFDPGFGHSAAGGAGSRAVLEVRSHEVPFILEHGQIVGRLVYETMLAAARQALRRRHRLQLPGAGPEAEQAF